MRGRIVGVDVDTSFFVGNHPVALLDRGDRQVSGRSRRRIAGAEGAPWRPILAGVAAAGRLPQLLRDRWRHASGCWTHLRLNIYPDGGVARFRAYGEVVVDWTRVGARRPRSRSGEHQERRPGARRERHALRLQGQHDHAWPRERTWATAGKRAGGADRATIGRLSGSARRGLLTRVEIDTNHFKGNYPDSASLEGCLAAADSRCGAGRRLDWLRDSSADEAARRTIGTCSRASCSPPDRYRTCGSTSFRTAASAVCASMEPWRRLDEADAAGARDLLRACCGSTRWVERMARAPSVRRSGRRCWPPRATSGSRSAKPTGARRLRTIRGLATRDPASGGLRDPAPVRARAEGGGRRRCGRPDGARGREPAFTSSAFGYIFIVCATGRTRGGDAGAA